MTTLPQTAIRLPRPLAMQPSSLPGPHIPGGPPLGPGAHQMTGADVWRVVRSNMWLILSVLLISVIAGFVINYFLAKYYPKYTAFATVVVNLSLQVDPLKPGAQTVDMNVLSTEQKSNVEYLKDPARFGRALQNPSSPIRDTTWFNQFHGNTALAKQDLRDNLIVSPILDTRLIRIEMDTRDPQDGKKIIQAIVEQLRTEQSERNAEAQQAMSVELTSRRDRYDQRHQDLVDDMRGKQVSLNITNTSGSGRLMIKENEAAELNRLKMESELKLTDVQNEAARIESQITAGVDPPSIVDSINRDPQVARYTDMITNYDLQILRLESTFLTDNQQLKDAKAQRDIFAKKLEEAQNQVRKATRLQLLDQAHAEVDSAKHAVDQITQRIAAQETEIQNLNKDLGDYQNDRDQLIDIEAKQKEIADRLEQITQIISQKNLANLEWSSYPDVQDVPSFPELKATMGLSIGLGLLLSLGIAFARELLDTTVRSPRDISRLGNMTVLGMVPHEDDDPQARGTRLPLVIFEAPQSMMAEQLRQVRTRLQHAASLDTTRTILITSPSPDDGKSTIAANLASGLALNGRRILLVDANFRRPSVHRMFNLANDVGFSDVLNKLDVFETAVQETQVPNLYVLPSGLKPTNATELLESQLLVDFIERALEEFDHVIFDSGPLLFVSETVALAPRVDGVVTVVRASTNSRGLLSRLRDSLRQIKAEHLGVVLNAVRSQGGGYYRSNIRTYYDYQNGHAA